MTNETANNTRLGLFVSVGLLILIVSLYLIGKNQNFFGSSFRVRIRFSNISGLVAGNNVRYSGVQAGTVDRVQMLNDTTVELVLLIDKKLQQYIHENTIASIGNDGLMGNKVINLAPNPVPAPLIQEGGLLYSKRTPYTDEMIETLSGTNTNVKVLSEKLISIAEKINRSEGLWSVLNDTSMRQKINASLNNIHDATLHIKTAATAADELVKGVQNGKGAAGALLNDETTASNLKQAIANINNASSDTRTVLRKVDSVITTTQNDIAKGKGLIHAVLKDSSSTASLNSSLQNIQKGTAAFNENMEALKHNFLTRGYFRKKNKQRNKLR